MENVVSFDGSDVHTISPCELGRPHAATCLECRQTSNWIHEAALQIKQAAETADELLAMASGPKRQERRHTLLTAASILLRLISKTAALEIVDSTCSARDESRAEGETRDT